MPDYPTTYVTPEEAKALNIGGWRVGERQRVRTHRLVWALHNGPIPDGWEIHHKDSNRENFAADNLEGWPRSFHRRLRSRTPGSQLEVNSKVLTEYLHYSYN